MTVLHARLDLLEGALPGALVGAASGVSKRAFTVLSLMRSDGTTGVGEASPLPGYSPDSIDEVVEQLQRLTDGPVRADPLANPFELLSAAFAANAVQLPSARFALETALLDWLGHTRGEPVHVVVGGHAERAPIPIADLVQEASASDWPKGVDALVGQGATHLKLKIGADLDREVAALKDVRRTHPALPLRLDGNQRVPLDVLRRNASSLEALELELVEEPVPPDAWNDALDLPLPFALDESLRSSHRDRLLESGRVRAIVLKPTILGGLQACLEVAERAAELGVDAVVSHTFDGPIARAATAELALVLQTGLAAGLGEHPALRLWTPARTAAIRGREIVPHDSPGLGLTFEEEADG